MNLLKVARAMKRLLRWNLDEEGNLNSFAGLSIFDSGTNWSK